MGGLLASNYTLKGTLLAIVAGAFLLLLGGNLAQAVNTYADVQWKGPLGLGFHFEGWKPHALRADGDLTKRIAAEHDAGQAQAKILTVTRTIYVHDAKDADNDHARSKTIAGDAADRHIAASRVVCPEAGAPGQDVHAAADRDPGVPAGMPEAAVVAESEADVRAAADTAAYAVDAHNWAMKLIRDGVAVPAAGN